jgi:DNA invertase Pin-like site-specific DNA recombinase
MGGRKIMRGVRGLINELYLDDLRQKTHRGQVGQVDRGFVAGGKSFGYQIVKGDGGSRYEIDETEAGWVRWMFERYAEGQSARAIAHEMNRQGVKSARGGTWGVSAVYGCPNKGSGIMNNELYAGRYIWNRSQWVKDPDTGARQRIERPKEEWRIIEVPELRIVSPELWSAARLRMDGPRLHGGRGSGRPTRTLFGGLMKCPHCGSAIIAVNGRQYGCTAHKDRGTTVCPGVYFSRDLAEKRLLGTLKDQWLSATAQKEMEEMVQGIFASMRKQEGKATAGARARSIELDAEIGRLVDAIASVGLSNALQQRLQAAEAEKSRSNCYAYPGQETGSGAGCYQVHKASHDGFTTCTGQRYCEGEEVNCDIVRRYPDHC